jgi:hypothetical protein
VDVLPYVPEVSLEQETQAVYALVNATAVLDKACVSNYSVMISTGIYDMSQAWKCLYGQYRLPFVRTPFLVSASQFDKFQYVARGGPLAAPTPSERALRRLGYNEGGNPPYNASQVSYADAFQLQVRSVLSGIPTAEQPGSAVFTSACFKHCVSQLSSFWGVRVGTQSLKSWLELWYFGVQNDPVRYTARSLGLEGDAVVPPMLA